MSERRSFSLGTLFLLTTIVALIVGVVVMRQQVFQARAERDEAVEKFTRLQGKFGFLDIEDETKIHFSRIQNSDETAYRAWFPKNCRFLLHLSDVKMKNSKIPEELPRTKTISVNTWRDGHEEVFKFGVWGSEGEQKVVFETDTEGTFFDYKLEDWNNGNHPNEGFDLNAQPQVTFDPDQRVTLMYFGNDKLERGIVIWLEPYEQWEAFRKKQKQQ